MKTVKREDLSWFFPWTLFLVFLNLKLNQSIDWSWWLILSPILIATFLYSFCTADEEDGEIVIDPNQPLAGKHIVLIHEVLHVADEILVQRKVLKRRTQHEFISNAAPFLLALFIEFGFWKGLTSDELHKFMHAMQHRNKRRG